MNPVLIAAVAAHMANRAYCIGIGDMSQPTWDDAPEWQRKSAIEGVHKALNGATPEQLHESWSQSKLNDGWRYGERKDPELKTHPCLVPYSELPQAQRLKDSIYSETVKAITGVI